MPLAGDAIDLEVGGGGADVGVEAGGGGGDEIDGDVDIWMVELIGGDVGGDAVKEHPVIPALQAIA